MVRTPAGPPPGTPGAVAPAKPLRGSTEAVVLGLAREVGGFDRAQVARATGLTPQGASKVLARLQALGLVAPQGARRRGVGKPATVYRAVPQSCFAVGGHVTRRSLRLVLTDLLGAVHASRTAPLPADYTPDDVLEALDAGLDALLRPRPGAAARLVGVGLGMVGPLDHAHGLVRDAHRLRHWHDVPLGRLAAARLGLAVHVDKDVTAGVTAAAWRRGAGFRHGAFVMVETGIGAGLWLDGAAHRGAHTNAGEFGHTVLQLDGDRCVCGRHGCLEVLHDRAVAAGDVALAARVLAVGVVDLLLTVDVDHVVLGGADLLAHSAVYLAAVREALAQDLHRPDWLPVEVSVADLGVDAVAAGAAMQVLESRFGTGP